MELSSTPALMPTKDLVSIPVHTQKEKKGEHNVGPFFFNGYF